MGPDEQFLEKRNKAEQDKLQEKLHALTDVDRKDIYEKGTKTILSTNPLIHLQCHSNLPSTAHIRAT